MATVTFRCAIIVIFISHLTSTEGVTPVCPEEYDIQVTKVQQVLDSSVHCFNTSTPCTDLDNELNYTASLTGAADVLSYDGDCLTLLRTDFTESKYCFTVTATEIGSDPAQFDETEACVIFNEVPTFGEDMVPRLIDLESVTDAVVMIQVPVSTEPDNIQAVSITAVDPSSFAGDFSVGDATLPAITYTVNKGAVTNVSDISLTVSVSDDGNPVLTAEKVFSVVLVKDAVTCTVVSPVIYLDVDDPSDTATGFTCQSSADNTLTYTTTGDEGIAVSIDSAGTVSLGPSTPVGRYEIGVEATSIYSIKDSFNITIGAGRKPSCTIASSTLTVRQNDTTGTVYAIFSCVSEGENEDDINLDIADAAQDNFFNADSTKNVGDDGSVTFSVNIILDNVYVAATFPSMVTVDVSNVHGTVSHDFTITLINMPPVLTLSEDFTTVLETADPGDNLYTFTASDVESNDNLDFSVLDAVDPSALTTFSISSAGVLTTSAKLNATLVSSYLLTVSVSDPEGESDSANFTLMVTDVNETPQCNYVTSVVNLEADLTSTVNQPLVTIDCFDTDLESGNKQLSYTLSGLSSDFAGYFGFSDPSSRDLLLLQPLDGVSVAVTPSTSFTVTVADQGTPPLSVDLDVTVTFIDKKPICTETDFQLEISEKTDDASCFNLTHTCTDPTSEGLNFDLMDISPDEGFKSLVSSFNLQESDTTLLPYITMCISVSLDGQPGTYKANMNVSNSHLSRIVTVSVVVTDINDPPVINNIPTEGVTVTETASVADVVVHLNITDQDPGSNGDLTYAFEAADPAMSGSSDFQLQDNGQIEVAKTLNATKQSTYVYTVTATDGGGLSASISLTITVEDVNQPPQCEVPEDFSVNATAEPGFVIGNLVCWDSDVTPAYKTISYTVRPDPVLIAIADDGTITLLDTIPYDEGDLVYTVTVSNGGEGDTAGPSINITVTILYNKDFPPSCNATSMDINFLDTDVPGCAVGKVKCTSPVQTAPTYSIASSSLTDNIRVNPEDEESSISLRICTQDGFKDDIGTYQVVTSVTNGLGSVLITWDVTVTDINEPPFFQKDSYYWELPENTPIKTTFAVFEHVDDREFDPSPETWDGLLLIQAKDPDVKTPNFQFTNVADIGSYQWKDNDTRVESTDIPLAYSFGEFFVNGTLDVSLIYIFTIQIFDGQGLSASVDFTINITDVNEAPTCNVTSLTFDLSLKTEVNTKLDSLFCTNDDYDAAKREIVYTLDGTNKEYFSITSVGEIWTLTRLPRVEDTLQFKAVAVDGENSSLKHVVDVLVNVNRTVSVECTPIQEPPPVWVINSCVDITLNCVDPVADDSSTITYTESGNYTQGFDLTGDSGVYKLCYTKTIGGSYELNVVVDNGLEPATVNVFIDVVYQRSTPNFDQQKYEVNVSESAGVGETQLKVTAVTAGEFAGTISYTILDYTPSSTSSYISIEPTTGDIKPAKDLSELVQSRIFTLTLTVQATDDRSALQSTVKVKVNIQEVNLEPQCQEVSEKNINVDDSISTLIATLQCTDSNVQDKYKAIVYSLDNNYFGVDADGLITIKSNLPLTTDTHVLKVNVGDGGLSIQVTVIIYVNMLIQPVLKVTEVTTTSVTLAWTFTRSDYSDVVKRFLLNYALTGTADGSERWLTISSTATNTQLTGLTPGTGVQMKLYADTNYGNASSSFFSTETAVLTKIAIRFKDKNTAWDPEFINPASNKFKAYATGAKSDLLEVLRPVKGLHQVKIIGLSKGSVYVDAVLAVNQTGNISAARQTIQDAVYSGSVGGTEVEGAVSIVAGDKYAVIESIELNQDSPSALNEGVNVTVKCPLRLVGEGLTPLVKWAFNNIEINNIATGRFSQDITRLDTDVFGYEAMLNIRSVKKRDEGAYSCKLTTSDGELQKSRSLLMSVVQKPTVDLRPLTNNVESGSTVELTCTVVSGGDNELDFKWFRDGKAILIPPVTEVNSRKQILTIANARANSDYYCQVTNTAGSDTSETSNIYIDSSDIANCPEDEDPQGTVWPSSPVGQTVKLPCPEGSLGTVSRECSLSGEWLKSKYTPCKLQTLLSLQDEVGRLEDGIEETGSDDIIDTLANVTGSKPLVSGDLNLTINILERVVQDTKTKEEIKLAFVEDVVNTADSMLQVDTDEWEDLEQDNDSEGVTGLMQSLDSVGQAASLKASDQDDSSDDSLTVVSTDRLVMAYGKANLQNIEFPGEGSKVPQWIKNSKDRVFLNKESFSNEVPGSDMNTPNGKMGYSVIYYASIDKLLQDIESESPEVETDGAAIKRVINSKIVSFSLNPRIDTLSPPVRLTLEHGNRNSSNPSCSYLKYQPLNGRRPLWSSDGCVAVSFSENSTVCECDHLTNFAILMSPGTVSDTHMQILSIISAVGCGVSILFLLITILIYCCLWRYVKSDRATILINLCIALIIAYSIFLGGVTQTENKDVCTAISALLHYFFLVVFFLMLAEGVEVLVSVVYVFNTKSRLLWLLLLSWGVPLVVVGVSLGVTELEGYGNHDFCWLSLDNGLLWAFVAPALLVIVANLVIICIVLRTMFSTTFMLTKSAKDKGKAGLKAICVLLPLMGVTWVFGIFSVNNDLVVFQYLFAVFNSLQGFFIFVFHCIVSRQVRDGFRNRRRRYRAKSFKTTGTESSSQIPASKLNSTSEEEKSINDLDKRIVSPFIDADRQVQQLANKLYPNRANLNDEPKSPKPKKVVPPVDPSDVKLQNMGDKERWLTDGHVLLTDEPSIEENDAITIGSPSKKTHDGAPPSPVKKNAWGEGKKAAPVHFSDYKLGETPLKKAGQLPPIKKPTTSLVNHYGPPPPDILADPKIQNWKNQEEKIRESRDRLDQVYISQDPLPLHQDKPKKPIGGRKSTSHSQKSRSSTSSGGRKAEPVTEESEEVETIHLYEQTDMPLYRGVADEPRPARPRSYGERKKRQHKYHNYEAPRVMVNSEEDLSRYGRREPFGGIRTTSNAGGPGLGRSRHQQDVRWQNQNYPYQW